MRIRRISILTWEGLHAIEGLRNDVVQTPGCEIVWVACKQAVFHPIYNMPGAFCKNWQAVFWRSKEETIKTYPF